jgi:predicted dehydrogenase
MIATAIIGTGRIASLLEDDPLREKPCTHAGALAGTGKCLIAGGADSDGERRDRFAARWGAPVFEDARRMIREVRPRIVVVATHPDSHEHYTTMAADEGVPVVVCEKPLAHTPGSARRIVRLERSGRVRIVVNHERRFSRDYQLARNAVRECHFGKLLGIYGTLYFGGRRRHDRVLLHDGTHMIDAIHFLTGERIRLSQRVGAMRASRSSVFLHGKLPQAGSSVCVEIGAERNYLHFELRLSFSDGEIRLGNGIFSLQRSVESPYYESFRSLAEIPRTPPEPTGYFIGMMNEAVRLVEDPSARSQSSAEDAWAVLRVIRAARAAPLFR